MHAQLQAGALTRSRLVIAAFFGHLPAREVLELSKGALALTGLDLTPLRRELNATEYGSLRFRATGGALHAALKRRGGSDPTPVDALRAAERWITCPCATCARSLQGWADRCARWENPDVLDRASERAAYARGVGRLCQAVVSHGEERAALLDQALELATYEWIWVTHKHGRLERMGDPLHLRQAWRRELPPWALGRSDPIRHRVLDRH